MEGTLVGDPIEPELHPISEALSRAASASASAIRAINLMNMMILPGSAELSS